MNKYINRIIIDVPDFKMQLRCKKMQSILNFQLRIFYVSTAYLL